MEDETTLVSAEADHARQLATRVQQRAAATPDSRPQDARASGGDLAVGDVVKSRFKLVERLPLGGMSVVFKAVDLLKEEAGDANPIVAVKVLNALIGGRSDALEIVQREARNTQKLAHPNVVTVHDFDRDGELLYVTMEYLEGRPLDDLVKDAALSGEVARHVIAEICRGLEYAHQKGVVHSDLKPGNVFVTGDGRVKILDFGIARVSSDVTRAGTDAPAFAAYTPMYASPEQMIGAEPSPADDVFALGCVSYTLLAGEHPFSMPANEARARSLSPHKRDGISMREWRALGTALEFDRASRLTDAAAFERAFFVPPGRRLRIALLSGLLASLVLAAGLAGYLTTVESPEEAIPVEVREQANALYLRARSRLATNEVGARRELLEALNLNPYHDGAIATLEAEIVALLGSSFGPDVSEGLGYLVQALNHGVVDERIRGIASAEAERVLARSEHELSARELGNLRSYACELKDINDLGQRQALLAMLRGLNLRCPDQL